MINIINNLCIPHIFTKRQIKKVNEIDTNLFFFRGNIIG